MLHISKLCVWQLPSNSYVHRFEVYSSMSLDVTGRLTEINESDVYICESRYLEAERQIRKLPKGLKVGRALFLELTSV